MRGVPVTNKMFSGWGRTAWSSARAIEVATVDDIVTAIRAGSPRGIVSRGLGRAYGAAAQNAGGVVLECANDALMESVHLDRISGIMTAPAGVSLDAILRYSVPLGWFVPVTPGTRFVTVGGAIASDIHGKNHHVDGSFGDHVVSMRLALASGDVVEVSRRQHPEWFWATIGGMGLTGVVVDATFSMMPIESALVRVETERLQNFDAVIAAMSHDGNDDDYRYSVAWVDMLATGASMGRGVLTRGEHATAAEVHSDRPLDYDPKVRLAAPGWMPNGLLNKWTVRAFNEAWFRRAPLERHESLESIPAFFHPLDGVRRWNTMYGSQGFIQYQFIIPLSETELLRSILRQFSDAGVASFLAVLKRMGKGNDAPMSFPTEGWTLSLDIAAGSRVLPALLAHIDSQILDAGGRHYLAKDAHVTRDAVRRGYPGLSEWQRVRNEMDPQKLWMSDLGRRLHLVD